MRISAISLAVAGIVAAASASAADINVYVSGASAQRNFWKADMVTSVCGTNAMTTWSVTGTTGVVAPDNAAYTCTVGITGITGATVGTTTVALMYSAELGSIYGIAPFLGTAGRPTQRLFVNAGTGSTPSDCAAGTTANTIVCTVTGYDVASETFSSTNSNALVMATPMVGVTDVEPKFWAQAQNWPAYAAVGTTAPTAAEIAAIGTYGVVNGQVFSVIANNSSPIATVGNISSASMKAILTGKYDVWGDVPEVGASNTTPIKLCRRDQGSGTQVSASIFFTGFECGRSQTGIVTTAAPGAMAPIASVDQVVENTTTGNVQSCVRGANGAIGITSISTSSNWTTLKLDGVQANQHNAAAGIYPFAFENFLINKSSGNAVVAKLLANAKKASSMGLAESATQTAGVWAASSPKGNFAVPALGFGNTKSIANLVTTSQAATALVSRGGDNCKVVFNDNGT